MKPKLENIFARRLDIGPSLVVQWLGICLPMQGTRDPPWFRNWDPTCLGATRPVCLNYRAHALPDSACRKHWSPCPTTRSLSTAAREQPRFLQLEKAQAQKQRASVLHQRLNTANIFFLIFEDLHINVYSSSICNSQKLGAIQMFLSRWTNWQTVTHPFNELILCNIKKWTINKCNTDKFQIHYGE